MTSTTYDDAGRVVSTIELSSSSDHIIFGGHISIGINVSQIMREMKGKGY